MFKYSVKKKIKDLPGNVSVFEAVQKDLERPVEIRVLNNFVKKESDEYLRFEREFKTIARLDHPNIIKVFDWGIASDKIYYVAEMKPAVTFEEYASSGRMYFSVPDILSIGAQVAAAAAYLHKNSIIHRDITFSSINYVENKKSAYIANFSLVKNQNLEDLTAKGVSQFQAGQMLPERMKNLPVDARADVFLFGAFFYQLATGKCPLYDQNGNPRLLKEGAENFEKPSTVRSDLAGSGIDEIALKCLSFNPDDRYATADHLVSALKEAEEELRKGKKKRTSSMPAVAESEAEDTETDDELAEETPVRGKGRRSLKSSATIKSVQVKKPVPDDPFEKAKAALVSAAGNTALADQMEALDAKILVGGIAGTAGFIAFFFLLLLLL